MFIFQVGPEHAGQYQCQPFNKRGSEGKSPPIQVIIKDPPTLLNRPNAEYIKNVGGSVSFSCLAAGTPKPEIRWRRVCRLYYIYYSARKLVMPILELIPHDHGPRTIFSVHFHFR